MEALNNVLPGLNDIGGDESVKDVSVSEKDIQKPSFKTVVSENLVTVCPPSAAFNDTILEQPAMVPGRPFGKRRRNWRSRRGRKLIES
ncbi:hypothetical protein SUGI_0364560 [Cryptomeria japonica]|nr:hypothetical protein SUGI_0364560 [Cryptomeria japonica]